MVEVSLNDGLSKFRAEVAKLSDSKLEQYKGIFEKKISFARNRDTLIAAKIVLDEILFQQEMRKRYPIGPDEMNMTDEEIFEELGL